MTTRRRALLLAGWLLLVAGPALGAWTVPRVDAAAIAYGSEPPSVALAVLRGAAPAAVLAAAVFLVVVPRVRRTEGGLRGFDGALVAASELAGWALAALGAIAVLGVMVFGGPPGIIGGFALAILAFSLLGRSRR